ncbi:MAG TPA: hypothetical protein VK852_01940, partial [Desulfobacterales bacterium]|nr:hypothetical protein [Desulfobacterales bacterium]
MQAAQSSGGRLKNRLHLLPTGRRPTRHLVLFRYHFGCFEPSMKKKVHQGNPFPVEIVSLRAASPTPAAQGINRGQPLLISLAGRCIESHRIEFFRLKMAKLYFFDRLNSRIFGIADLAPA